MHQSRCIAEGGFKINNGPSTKDKGPMSQENNLETRDEASLPQPTQAGRIKLCQEMIEEAMRCLSNGDRDCVLEKTRELIENNCHNGYAVGKEVADGVKDVVHELWLVSDNEVWCGLLRMLRDLGISKKWVREALRLSTKDLNRWLVKCGIDWESKAMRNDIIKVIESLLRERFGWSEVRMCEEMFQFIGVDVNEFRRYGIEPCIWLDGLELLNNLRKPYWLGLAKSDLVVWKYDGGIRLELNTTNAVDAVFFLKILSMIKTPSLKIKRERGAPGMKYVHERISLGYYVYLGVNEWPWPIELSTNELERVLNGFSDEELAEYIAGEIDGDGTVWYDDEKGYVAAAISACKKCPKRINLDVLREIIAKRFSIVGTIDHFETADVLVFRGEKAVKLLRRVVKYIHHPLRRLRVELILALYDGKISKDVFTRLYEQTEYEQGRDDIKRNRGLETLARAAPQTHTHGDKQPIKRN
jgi:hypothetical protein